MSLLLARLTSLIGDTRENFSIQTGSESKMKALVIIFYRCYSRKCTVINLRAWASKFKINVKLERSLLI